MTTLRLADAIGDPFDRDTMQLRVLAAALGRPARARKRRKLTRVVRWCAVGRFACDAMLSVFAGAACGTGIAALLVAAAPIMAQLGGIA